MLRKILSLAMTAYLAKRAWDHYQTAARPEPSGAPAATPDDDAEAASVAAQPVAPESPLQYH